MTRSLRERRKQLLRDEILGAARSLLATKGYAAMAMDELAAQVGISKPTLYSHFPTKDDLVVNTIVHEMQRFIELLDIDLDQQSPLQYLVFLMRKIIMLHSEESNVGLRSWTPELFQLLSSHEEALICMRRIDEAIIGLVRAGMAAGEIDPGLDPAVVASTFHALVSTSKFASFNRCNALDPARAADTLAAIFARGVRPS